MDMEIWHIWIIIAVILLIVEIFTTGFLTAALALGCIVAAIAAYFNFGVEIQLLSFSIGTLIGFFGVRPFMLRYAHRKSEKIKTNAHALIGKTGKVIETIDHYNNLGRVSVEGEDWKAETETNETLAVGERVEVVNINSTILIVKPLNA